MGVQPVVPDRPAGTSSLDGAFRLVMLLAVVLLAGLGLRVLSGLAPGSGPGPSPSGSAPESFLVAQPVPAPALNLVDQDGRPFDPRRFRDGPSLVFFGYTHCPDVCPATMGIIQEVRAAYGSALGVVFVTVDPERDTVPWLKEYVRYLPPGFQALTGSPQEVRAAADAWGVRYARVEGTKPGQYSMAHTADVYLIDGAGRLRARFPFGTDAAAMLATVRLVAASDLPGVTSSPPGATPAVSPTPSPSVGATPAPSASATPSPQPQLAVTVVSSSVWAGGNSPVILALAGPNGRISDLDARVTVELRTDRGGLASPPTRAVAVRPPAVVEVSYVAELDIPSPGWWRLAVTVDLDGARLVGGTAVAALDPGLTAPLGGRAPGIRTPTLDDVGGKALAVTTDPLPDPRLSRTSTADALAANRPFVLVVDSVRFKVTPACGLALNVAKSLLDRWRDITFIHLEPYAYDVITDAPVLRGSLSDPILVPAADAWGVGTAPWDARSMPWVFVVDGQGVVRAKYQGVVGSGDLDVMISLIAAGG